MSVGLVLPAIAAVAVGLSSGMIGRRVHPRLATPLLTVLAAVVAGAVVGAIALVSVGFVLQQPAVAGALGWCRSLYRSHDAVPLWLGLAAPAGLVAMGLSAVWTARRWRRVLRAPRLGTGPLEVVIGEEPVAFAVPGRPGHVVVSTGMLRALDAPERRVLLAHERSHLRHRHDRYVRVAELAAAAVPVLRPLREHLRFATERWADEDAARDVGDRRLVARAIATAALAQADAQVTPALALAGLGVRARVEALLRHEPVGGIRAETATLFGVGAIVGSVAGATAQFHHVLAFAAHVCRL